MDRRDFLTTAAASTAWLAMQPVAKAAASERIRVGCVGVGGRAGALLKQFSAEPTVELAAICDLDAKRLPAAIEVVKSFGQKAPETHTDFRKLVDNKSLDVLVVGTPDHWHAIPTIMACQAGKDVYVEKPDGHNIVEGQRMVAAMKKYNRVIQMGTQSRSNSHFLSAMEYIRSGKLGRALVAKAWESSKQSSIGRPADSNPPEGYDYDFWLGPAPKRPFNVRRFNGNWRWFFDYGTGDLGNDGVHRLDIAYWGLQTACAVAGDGPLGFPRQITALGGHWYFDDMQEWPDTLQVTYAFPEKVGKLLTYEMRVWTPYGYLGEEEGAAVFGDKGYIVMGNGGWKAYAGKEVVAQDQGGYEGPAHVQNFLSCVKSRQKPNADLETVGHPSSLLCHTGNVAWRAGHQVEFDIQTEQFVNDPAANALRTRPEYRKPWTLPEV